VKVMNWTRAAGGASTGPAAQPSCSRTFRHPKCRLEAF